MTREQTQALRLRAALDDTASPIVGFLTEVIDAAKGKYQSEDPDDQVVAYFASEFIASGILDRWPAYRDRMADRIASHEQPEQEAA